MARVVLDVPAEKMQPFLHLISELELEKHSIASKINDATGMVNQTLSLAKISSKLLFDWEFFDNELEYE